MKTEIGKHYKNIHTNINCIVKEKNFFNIGYLEEGEVDNQYPHYTHYKTFQKHWKEVENEIIK